MWRFGIRDTESVDPFASCWKSRASVPTRANGLNPPALGLQKTLQLVAQGFPAPFRVFFFDISKLVRARLCAILGSWPRKFRTLIFVDWTRAGCPAGTATPANRSMSALVGVGRGRGK